MTTAETILVWFLIIFYSLGAFASFGYLIYSILTDDPIKEYNDPQG